MDIYVQNLNKAYIKRKRKIKVIEDFSYTFKAGRLYLLKGESGKGKTTLLTIMGLLQNEDSGEIYYGEKQVNQLSSKEKCKLRLNEIGIIFQDFNLFDNLTVLENIILVEVAEKKKKKDEAIKRAEEILELLNLNLRINHYPFELSGGEQQRVGIARAIYSNPSILIGDEPVSNLDEENSRIIVEFLKNYAVNKNKVVIVTSHNQSFDKYADEIIKM